MHVSVRQPRSVLGFCRRWASQCQDLPTQCGTAGWIHLVCPARCQMIGLLNHVPLRRVLCGRQTLPDSFGSNADPGRRYAQIHVDCGSVHNSHVATSGRDQRQTALGCPRIQATHRWMRAPVPQPASPVRSTRLFDSVNHAHDPSFNSGLLLPVQGERIGLPAGGNSGIGWRWEPGSDCFVACHPCESN